jgi:nucleotide-binding universal stress UspA family protein
MFKHILIPTDGSDLSDKALRGGLKLAKAMTQKVLTHSKIPVLVYR